MKKNSRPLFLLISLATAVSVLYTSYLTLIEKDFEIVEIEEESILEADTLEDDSEIIEVENENNLEIVDGLI